MKPKTAVIIIFIFLLATLLGCAGISKKDDALKSAGLLEPSAIARFSDIPVPAGFKLLAKDSYSFENTGVRVGVLRYEGKANLDQVTNFYKEQMPMYNWNLLNIIEHGDRSLNFDRETETCIINLFSKGNHIAITISLGPKSQGLRKIEKDDKAVR